MGKNSKSVLIIEDSTSVTSRLVRFLADIPNLQLLGSVRNGISGLKKIMEESPDIILLDIQLPGINGLEIIEILGELKRPPHIIVLTNNSNFYFKERCLALGADQFYDKTTQFEEAILALKKSCNEEA